MISIHKIASTERGKIFSLAKITNIYFRYVQYVIFIMFRRIRWNHWINLKLLNELNRFIQRASDGGLIVKWLEYVGQFSKKRFLYKYSEVHLESLYGVGMLFQRY